MARQAVLKTVGVETLGSSILPPSAAAVGGRDTVEIRPTQAGADLCNSRHGLRKVKEDARVAAPPEAGRESCYRCGRRIEAAEYRRNGCCKYEGGRKPSAPEAPIDPPAEDGRRRRSEGEHRRKERFGVDAGVPRTLSLPPRTPSCPGFSGRYTEVYVKKHLNKQRLRGFECVNYG